MAAQKPAASVMLLTIWEKIVMTIAVVFANLKSIWRLTVLTHGADGRPLRDAACEATESLAAQEVVQPPESPEVPAPLMTSPVLDEPEMTNSSSEESDSSGS